MRKYSGPELLRRGSQRTRKFTVSCVLVGTFALYSLLHARSGAATPAATTGGAGGTTGATSTTPVPTVPGSPSSTSSTASGAAYRDGTYDGSLADAQWGTVRVEVSIQNGSIANVQFLQYPNERDRSVFINQQADPILVQEAIQAQSAQVDIVSGATDTSEAFIQSLSDALSQAHT